MVLVNDQDEPIGTAPKSEVHTNDTPLHRAFSCFLFNSKGEVLLQQRSHKKKTWPRVWSNSCCGHPLPGEAGIDAVKRRVKDELGIRPTKLLIAIPYYKYRAERDGVVEHEICPVFAGKINTEPKINPDEVEAIKWMGWNEFVALMKNPNSGFSEWCIEETELLAKTEILKSIL